MHMCLKHVLVQAVENIGTVMSNILKAQGRLKTAMDKLASLDTAEAKELPGWKRSVITMHVRKQPPRSLKKVEHYHSLMNKDHDILADLKSEFDAYRDDQPFPEERLDK